MVCGYIHMPDVWHSCNLNALSYSKTPAYMYSADNASRVTLWRSWRLGKATSKSSWRDSPSVAPVSPQNTVV